MLIPTEEWRKLRYSASESRDGKLDITRTICLTVTVRDVVWSTKNEGDGEERHWLKRESKVFVLITAASEQSKYYYYLLSLRNNCCRTSCT